MSRPCIILRGKVTIGDIGPRVFTACIHCRINNMGPGTYCFVGEHAKIIKETATNRDSTSSSEQTKNDFQILLFYKGRFGGGRVREYHLYRGLW